MSRRRRRGVEGERGDQGIRRRDRGQVVADVHVVVLLRQIRRCLVTARQSDGELVEIVVPIGFPHVFVVLIDRFEVGVHLAKTGAQNRERARWVRLTQLVRASQGRIERRAARHARLVESGTVRCATRRHRRRLLTYLVRDSNLVVILVEFAVHQPRGRVFRDIPQTRDAVRVQIAAIDVVVDPVEGDGTQGVP